MFLFKRNGYYQIQLTDDRTGKIRRISTHSKSKADALKFLSKFKERNLSKEHIRIPDISLSKFQDEYINHVSFSKTKSYITSVKLSFRMFIKYTGDIKLLHIDARQVDHFIAETFARSKYAAALYYRTLKAAFSKAVEWGYLEHNPFVKVKLPRIPQKMPIFISIEEMNLILKNSRKECLKPIFLFAYYTGLRLSEVLNLHWNDIDLECSFIKVSNTKTFTTKGKKERYIPVNKTIKDMLYKLNRGDNNSYVFCDSIGCRFNADYVSKQFKKAVRLSSINKEVHFHSLRHSFASNLVQHGISLYAVKELLGHENILTTQIYSHLRKQDLLDGVLKLDDDKKQ